MSEDLHRITLRNGVRMPRIAFGCAFGNWVGTEPFQGFRPELAWRAVNLALDTGYRAFDGARVYGTESIVGHLIGQRLAAGELTRDELFITTKLAHPAAPPHINISHLRTLDADTVTDVAARVRDDMLRTLDDLMMGYVDLLLIHWPSPFSNQDPVLGRRMRATIWQTFREFFDKGTARAIGVSNFSVTHLQQLLEDAPDCPPMVNQVEVHPYCRDPILEAYCRDHGIVLTAYAPFASGTFGLLTDPVIIDIAQRHGKSAGQVILRWHLQRGRAVLPKSSSPERLRHKLEVFDFALPDDELAAIDALGTGEPRRTCPDPGTLV